MVIGREDGKKGEGRVRVTVSLDSLIFVFSIYGNSTEKVRVLVRIRVRKKHKIFMYGFFSLAGTEIWTGYGLIWAPGSTEQLRNKIGKIFGTGTGTDTGYFQLYKYGYGFRTRTRTPEYASAATVTG